MDSSSLFASLRPRSWCPRAFALLFALALVGGLLAPALDASQSISVTKQCNGNNPATISGTTTFTIGTAQTILWTAQYAINPGSCNGNDFYLHTDPNNLIQFALTTTGVTSGTYFLNPGTYDISITFFGMGAGTYAIEYDRTASIGVSPNSHDFGHQLENDSSPSFTFTVAKSGDLDVNGITATIEGADASFFSLSNLPASNSNAPVTFKAQFNAGTINGNQSQVTRNAVIRVEGASNPAGTPVSDVLVSIQGTTDKRVPDIKYVGIIPSPVVANYAIGETKAFKVRVKNQGTQSLTFTSAPVLVNDNPANAFALAGAPDLSPLAAGSTRDFNLGFTPPATSSQDQVFNGHLEVHSDDPDEPVLICNFSGKAHEPRPIIRVEPQSHVLDYHDVEIGFSYSLGIIVHNDGDAPLVFDLTESDPADPDRIQWSQLSTPAGVTVAPGAASDQIQTFTPQVLGNFALTLRVAGTNHPTLPPPIDVLLTGNGQAPIPLNSVLVLDRSGSMADSAGPVSKMSAMLNAANIWTSLLRLETGNNLGDAMGAVKYNDTNQEYMPLQLLTAAHRTNLLNSFDAAAGADINRLKPDNATGIGGGMQRGADMLRNNPLEAPNTPARKHILVVLTDGIENRTPYILNVLPGIVSADNKLKIYSLGLGDDAEVGKLQSITTQAHGYHQVTGSLTGTQRYDLNTFYFKIFVDSADWQLVVDPTYAVSLATPNAQVVSTAQVCSSDLSAIFLIMDEPALRPYYDLSLMDPNGNVMTVGANVGGVPVQITEHDNYRILKVVFPDLSLSSSYVGQWKLMLVPNGKWQPRKPGPITHVADHQPGGSDPIFNGYNGLAPVGFGAAVGSNYRLEASATASPYEPGATITLTASLSDRRWPSVTGTVTVDATKPDGTPVNGITLYDDGTHGDVAASDGTWTTKFGQTSQAGSYKFFFNAIGHNDRGELAPRQATRYVSLTVPPRDPPPTGDGRDDCLPCPVLKWLWRIVIGLLILIVLLLLLRRRQAQP